MNYLCELRWESSCELTKISHAELHFLTIKVIQKQSSGGFCKKGVLKNFTNLTEKHLCWSLLKVTPAPLSKKRL